MDFPRWLALVGNPKCYMIFESMSQGLFLVFFLNGSSHILQGGALALYACLTCPRKLAGVAWLSGLNDKHIDQIYYCLSGFFFTSDPVSSKVGSWLHGSSQAR